MDQLAEVPDPEGRALFDAFLSRFTGGVDARWWWEHFTLPDTSVRFDDGSGYLRILELVPDGHEKVWFVAEDGLLPYYPVYDATPMAAQQVICECYRFEYYLISKDLSWLLCENHHDYVVAIGEDIQRRMPKDIA